MAVDLCGSGPRYAFSPRAGAPSSLNWRLDSPKPLEAFAASGSNELLLRGWALMPGQKLRVATHVAGITRSFRLDDARGDVIKAMLDEPPQDHPKLCCGFAIRMVAPRKFSFGFELDGELVWLLDLDRID